MIARVLVASAPLFGAALLALAWGLPGVSWELWASLGAGSAVGVLCLHRGVRFQAMLSAMVGTMLAVAAVLFPDAVLRLVF